MGIPKLSNARLQIYFFPIVPPPFKELVSDFPYLDINRTSSAPTNVRRRAFPLPWGRAILLESSLPRPLLDTVAVTTCHALVISRIGFSVCMPPLHPQTAKGPVLIGRDLGCFWQEVSRHILHFAICLCISPDLDGYRLNDI
jgi:hypothetical protein